MFGVTGIEKTLGLSIENLEQLLQELERCDYFVNGESPGEALMSYLADYVLCWRYYIQAKSNEEIRAGFESFASELFLRLSKMAEAVTMGVAVSPETIAQDFERGFLTLSSNALAPYAETIAQEDVENISIPLQAVVVALQNALAAIEYTMASYWDGKQPDEKELVECPHKLPFVRDAEKGKGKSGRV